MDSPWAYGSVRPTQRHNRFSSKQSLCQISAAASAATPVGLNTQNRPNIRFKKYVKMTNLKYDARQMSMYRPVKVS